MNVSGVQYEFIFLLKESCSLLVGHRAYAAYHEVTEQKQNTGLYKQVWNSLSKASLFAFLWHTKHPLQRRNKPLRQRIALSRSSAFSVEYRMCNAPKSCTLAIVWTQKGGHWTGTDLIHSVLVFGDVKFELDEGKFLIVTIR